MTNEFKPIKHIDKGEYKTGCAPKECDFCGASGPLSEGPALGSVHRLQFLCDPCMVRRYGEVAA